MKKKIIALLIFIMKKHQFFSFTLNFKGKLLFNFRGKFPSKILQIGKNINIYLLYINIDN